MKNTNINDLQPARFFVAFEGALPIKVTWFRDGKELKPTFETQVRLASLFLACERIVHLF